MYGQRRSLRSAAASSSAVNNAQEVEVEEVGQGGDHQMFTDSQMTDRSNNTLPVDEGEGDGSSDNEDVEEYQYGDMHRLVLQGVMSAGFLDTKGVKKLFQESSKFLKSDIPETGIDFYSYIQKVVREINERIKNYDMMIRSATCEITGEKFYVFLVTIEKPIMKMQTYFAKVELDLFQKILDSLLRKHNNFAISTTKCVNIAGELDIRGFSKVNAEDFVDRMICMQYFTKIYKDNDTTKDEKERDYDITLGFRTIREFEPILRDVYGDIFGHCCLCKTILLNGLQCPKCPIVVHRHCLRKYIKNCKICVSSSCKALWKNERVLPVRTRDGCGMIVPESGPSSSASVTPGHEGSASVADGQISQGSGRVYNGFGDDVDMPVLEPVVAGPGLRGKRGVQSPPKQDRRKNKEIMGKSVPTRSSRRTRQISSSMDESD